MKQAADTTVLAGVRRTAFLSAAIAGALALLAGLFLAPWVGDVFLGTKPLDLFPSLQNPAFNQPEPTEFARYIFAAAAPVAAATAVVLVGGRSVPAWAERAGQLTSIVLPVALLGALAVAWGGREEVDHLYGTGVRFEYFGSGRALIAALLAGGLAAAAAHPSSRRLAARAASSRPLIALAPLLAVFVATLFLLPAVQTEGSFSGASPFVSWHLTSTVADVEAVVNGATPGVDVAAEYANVFSYLLAPPFDLTGFEPGAMTTFLTLFSGIALMALYRVLAQVTESEVAGVVLFIPVAALSVTPTGGEGAWVINNANVFQILPIRYIGPTIVAWLLVRHLRGKRFDVGRRGIFLVAGLSALSTPDFGIAAVLGAAVALALLAATEPEPLRRLSSLLVDALLGLVASLALLSVITLIRSGSLPHPSVLLYYPEQFRKGFGLIPMDTVGLYWFLYATFAGALILASIRAVSAVPNRALTGMLAFFAVLGLAAGVYYVGRTNKFTLVALFPIWGMTLALLSWLVVQGIAERPAGLGAVRAAGPLGGLVLFGLGLAITAVSWAHAPWKEVDRLATEIDAPPTEFDVDRPAHFVEGVTEPGENVALMCRSAFLIADRGGVRNVSPISDPQNILGETQVGEVVDALKSEGGDKVFVCKSVYSEINTSLAARGFQRVATDRALGITEWGVGGAPTSAAQGGPAAARPPTSRTNLRVSDFPQGWRVTATAPNSALFSCLGIDQANATQRAVLARGPQASAQFAVSQLTRWPSGAAAAKAYAALRGSHGATCVRSTFQSNLAALGVSSAVNVQGVPPPPAGGSRAIAYTESAEPPSGDGTSAQGALIFFTRAKSSVLISGVRFGGRPFPASLLSRMSGSLARRLSARP